MLFQAAQKIVFIGDSITDCGRQTAPTAPYGDGYVSMVRNFLLARYPDRNLTIVNKGIGGNTVRDLAQRWSQDVMAEKPDWLVVFIGINDVWRTIDHSPGAVPLDEYRDTLHRLLKQTRDSLGTKFILAEPYIIEANRSDNHRRLLEVYAGTMRGLAPEFAAVVVPTQAAFDQALAYTPSTFWSSDRFHPNAPGHAVLALAFLRAFDFALS